MTTSAEDKLIFIVRRKMWEQTSKNHQANAYPQDNKLFFHVVYRLMFSTSLLMLSTALCNVWKCV